MFTAEGNAKLRAALEFNLTRLREAFAVFRLDTEQKRRQSFFNPRLHTACILSPGTPLVISDHLLEEGVTASKFGQPVRILSDRAIGPLPHIRFRSVDVTGTQAIAVIEYKAEGIEVAFTMEQSPANWWTVVGERVARREPGAW